jgi:hypothetical protein
MGEYDLFYMEQGRSGFTEAMNYFYELFNAGYSSVDIMLMLREEFPDTMVDTVLAEARLQGYI